MNKTRADYFFEKRYANKKTHTSLRYPLSLENEGHGNIVLFEANTRSGSTYRGTNEKKVTESSETVKTGSNNGMTKKTNQINASVALFTPNEIKTSYGSDWQTTELGALGRLMDTGETISNIDSWSDLKGFWNNVLPGVTKESLKSIAAGIGDTLTPFNVKDAISVQSRTIENPYVEVMFNGVQNRTFSFSFKMIPRNKDEQREIEKIINLFKYYRAPSVKVKGSNNYWNYPADFNITFYHKGEENSHIHKIKRCAMTNMDVDYAGENTFITYKDGSPFSTTLTLEFTEMDVLTREDHEQGY